MRYKIMINPTFLLLLGVLFGILINAIVEYNCAKIAHPETRITIKNLLAIIYKNKWHLGAVIISTIVVTILLGTKFSGTTFAFSCVFSYSLLALTFVDLRELILPDVITKPLIVIGVVLGWFGIFTNFYDSLAGAFIGYFLFWGINYAFRKIRKKEGMGYGDFKLLSAIGAWIGATQIPLIILMSSFVGILVAILTHNISKNFLSRQIPFGPSLAFAGFVGMCYGSVIIRAYMSLFYL